MCALQIGNDAFDAGEEASALWVAGSLAPREVGEGHPRDGADLVRLTRLASVDAVRVCDVEQDDKVAVLVYPEIGAEKDVVTHARALGERGDGAGRQTELFVEFAQRAVHGAFGGEVLAAFRKPPLGLVGNSVGAVGGVGGGHGNDDGDDLCALLRGHRGQEFLQPRAREGFVLIEQHVAVQREAVGDGAPHSEHAHAIGMHGHDAVRHDGVGLHDRQI